MYETEEQKERVILIGVDDGSGIMTMQDSLNELRQLVDTQGAEVLGEMVQNLERAHTKHYFGKGKLEELKELIESTGATGVIADDELSSSQQRNMEKMLETKVMDRTMLILDIFARHAQTAEGKLQVELAQYRYNLTHLIGAGQEMSRLGGGIGTRGPGEKKLEQDRRKIRERLTELTDELKELEIRRKVQREKREKNRIPIMALVGYTNAGKSSLMNTLTQAGVLAENKLFATLDTVTRRIKLPNGTEGLLTDTVGFIQKLPHGLVKAFKATLDELRYADILIHVVDSSSPTRDEQMKAVYRTLEELDSTGKPIITVFNKIDLQPEYPLPLDKQATRTISVSAHTGQGTEELAAVMEEELSKFKRTIRVIVPYNQGNLINQVHKTCEILKSEHREEGYYLEINATDEIFNKLKTFEETAAL